MTQESLYTLLRERFDAVLREAGIENEPIGVVCRTLTPEEAIGHTVRKDFPIITGKDVMIEATFRSVRGQAFTDAPTTFSGSLGDVLKMDIVHNPHDRGIFIAVLNAVMGSLNRCTGTVHCRTDGPEQCAKDMLGYLRAHAPNARHIALIGYQPALLNMLAESEYDVRVLDLNPANVGQVRYGVTVEHGQTAKEDAIAWADLILCTGSTLCNGTITDYIGIRPEVLFFGITLAGSADLLGLKRVCFADRYE